MNLSNKLTNEIAEKYPKIWDKLYYKFQGKNILYSDRTNFNLNLVTKGLIQIHFYNASEGRGYGGVLIFSMLFGLLEEFFRNEYNIIISTFFEHNSLSPNNDYKFGYCVSSYDKIYTQVEDFYIDIDECRYDGILQACEIIK